MNSETNQSKEHPEIAEVDWIDDAFYVEQDTIYVEECA